MIFQAESSASNSTGRGDFLLRWNRLERIDGGGLHFTLEEISTEELSVRRRDIFY